MSMQAFEAAKHPRDDDGRFAPAEFDRSDVDLHQYDGIVSTEDFTAFELADDPYAMTDEEYNRSGSYDYPPVPRSANQVRAFWAKTQIPDVAIRQYEKVYAADVEVGVTARLENWDSTHPEPNKMLAMNKKDHESWVKERSAAEKEFRAERRAGIFRPYLRTAVRVMKMTEDARFLQSQEERTKVWDSKVSYSPEKQPATVREIDGWLGIRSDAFRDRALKTTAELKASTQDVPSRGEMNRAIAQLSEQIQQARDAAQGAHNAVIAGAEWDDRRAGRL